MNGERNRRWVLILGVAAAMVGAGCAAETGEVGSAGAALEEDDGGHGGGHGGHCEAAPIMEVGDFDGDGVIGSGDVEMISAYVEAGDYAAFFDMNADGELNGRDVSMVARNMGEPGTTRDAQMAALWAEVEPYRDLGAAVAAGYVPFTPDLQGHGVHWAHFGRIYSWRDRGGFQPGVPEGLNYTATGELVAAFYYAPGAIDLYDYGLAPVADTYFKDLPVPPSFDGMMPHEWHNHVGPCFGGATSPIPGFDQCVTESACYDDYHGSLWSPKFHMLHVWLIEFNECGPFAGIDVDVSPHAPEEPNHMACTLDDVVPVVVP